MDRRWIGLSRAKARVKERHGFLRGADHALHSLGMAGVLFFAAALNFALYPNALAAVVGLQPAHMDIVPALDTQQAAQDPLNPADVHLLAATAWAEARSEGELGMRAVAHVMVNRIGERFGDSLQTVILAPKQFSAWNIGDPNRPLAQNPEHYAIGGADKMTWETAQEIAREVLSGQSIDPTNGALFYHTRAVHPVWDRSGEGRLVIGAHVFFHDVPDAERIRPAPIRVTRVSARSANPANAKGPRAGRVNGVIQHAPASMAHRLLPGEQPGDLPAPAPAAADLMAPMTIQGTT